MSDIMNWYGFEMNSSQLIHNVPTAATHTFQVNNSSVASINASGLYIGCNLPSGTIVGYLSNLSSDA